MTPADVIAWVARTGVVSLADISKRYGVPLHAAKLIASVCRLAGRGDHVRMLARADPDDQLDLLDAAAFNPIDLPQAPSKRRAKQSRVVIVQVPRVIPAPVGIRSAPWAPSWAARGWPIDDSSRRIRLKPPQAGTTLDDLTRRYPWADHQPGDPPELTAYINRTQERMVECLRDMHAEDAVHTATKYDWNRLYTSTNRHIVQSRRAQG